MHRVGQDNVDNIDLRIVLDRVEIVVRIDVLRRDAKALCDGQVLFAMSRDKGDALAVFGRIAQRGNELPGSERSDTHQRHAEFLIDRWLGKRGGCGRARQGVGKCRAGGGTRPGKKSATAELRRRHGRILAKSTRSNDEIDAGAFRQAVPPDYCAYTHVRIRLPPPVAGLQGSRHLGSEGRRGAELPRHRGLLR